MKTPEMKHGIEFELNDLINSKLVEYAEKYGYTKNDAAKHIVIEFLTKIKKQIDYL